MSRLPELKKNSAGGYNLLTERDAGNPVCILTCKPEHSVLFWERMLEISVEALEDLKSKM